MAFDKADCVECLRGILQSVELVASATTSENWVSARHRWCGMVGDGMFSGYDLAGTLMDACEANKSRSVLRWIELNTDSGPLRRKRLTGVLNAMIDELAAIETGNPSDPFRWARESRDVAAARIPDELSELADYLKGVIALVDRTDDEYIGPASPAEWQKRFDMPPTTFSRRRKEMRVDVISPKSIRIHRDDVARFEKK